MEKILNRSQMISFCHFKLLHPPRTNYSLFNKKLLILALNCCRYIEYMCDMMAEEPIIPHSKPIIIRSIVMTPVPLFNKQRNGCRPFCEVYVGDERVLTTSQEYDKMK